MGLSCVEVVVAKLPAMAQQQSIDCTDNLQNSMVGPQGEQKRCYGSSKQCSDRLRMGEKWQTDY
jgi:hypothetical protein